MIFPTKLFYLVLVPCKLFSSFVCVEIDGFIYLIVFFSILYLIYPLIFNSFQCILWGFIIFMILNSNWAEIMPLVQEMIEM